MPERVLVLPAPARHRRNPVRTSVLDVAAKLGSAVTLSALVIVGAATVSQTSGPAPEPPTKVVTFQLVPH